jgi:hypothetical protein
LFVLCVAGIRFYLIWRERSAPVVIKRSYVERNLTDDEVVPVRHLYIDSMESAKVLVGKPVWMQGGYQLPYYPATGKHADYAHRVGLLPPAERLEVEGFFYQAAPAAEDNRVPHGTRQILMLIKRSDGKSYAFPVGFVQGARDETWYCDTILYYDDPHQMYKHWPADVWAAIDAHTVKPGMNELQTAMSLGQLVQFSSAREGNRTIRYNVEGRQWVVTFENDKATSVQPPR